MNRGLLCSRTANSCPRTNTEGAGRILGTDSFTATIGAEAIREMLKGIDLEKMQGESRAELAESDSDIKKKKIAKRLKLIEAFIASPATSRNG